MVSNKNVNVEHTIDRIGVSWRKHRYTGKPTKCVVEMRPPNWTWKLHFGSYDTEVEAMIARDYAALLRVRLGRMVLQLVVFPWMVTHPFANSMNRVSSSQA